MFQNRKNNKRGVAIIEMTIILPIFVYLLFTMLFLGITVYDGNMLESIVRQETRYASIQMAAEPKLNDDKTYDMVITKREDIKDKVLLDIQKQCTEKLIFYKLASSEVVYTPSPASWSASPNEKVSVKITVKRDDAFSEMDFFKVLPETITKQLLMRIEDHSMVIIN